MIGKKSDMKHEVRRRYSERARQVSELKILTSSEATSYSDGSIQSVMDKSTGASSDIYSQGDLAVVPLKAVAASAGCGNPTALADLNLGDHVLDLGSGGGIDCFLAARYVGAYGYVIGLDMSRDMLDLARDNDKTLGTLNVEFVEGHIENIPLPDCSVNVVISNCVICLSPDKDSVFNEAFRVLKAGGRLHISDIMAMGPMPKDLREDPNQWACCTSGAEELSVYKGRLQSAGFVSIEFTSEGNIRPLENHGPDIVSVKIVAYKS